MTERLVTIATYSQAIEADLSRTRLESEGIDCFLADEHTVTVNWLYSNAVGGVKLKVRESDGQRAIEILRRQPVTADDPDDQVAEHDEIRCPRCDSTDVNYERFSRRLTFASWLLLSFPFPFFKRKWECRKCGLQWKPDNTP